MCHTAINALGGSSESQAFEGGLIPMQNWYAPSLTSNKEAGLGDWTIEEITDYLRKGVSARGAVYGPMAEVVYNSLQYLNDDDIRAMAVYLKSLAQGTSPEKPATPLPSAESSLLLSLGKQIYDRECASCHGAEGLGMPPHYPPLAGNQSIQMVSAVNAIRMVLNGGYPPGTAGNPMPYGMPPFAHRLSDDEVAAVVTYIRTSWGNRGAAGLGAPGQRTSRGNTELRRVMINSSPPQSSDARLRGRARRRHRPLRSRRRHCGRRHRDRDRDRAVVRVLSLRLPAAGACMSMTRRRRITASAKRSQPASSGAGRRCRS